MASINNLINQRKNPVLKSIGIYTFTNFFAKGASFLLLFIFTNPKYILPSENGLLSLFSNGLLFLMPFISLGIIHSTSTDFFKHDKKEFRSFFTTGFIMPTLMTILSVIVLFFVKDHLQKVYGFPPTFIWLIPVITFLTFCNEQVMGLIRNNDQPTLYLKANMAKTVLELGISFVLVVFFAWRWKGRVAGILISYTILGFFALYYFIRKKYFFGVVKKKYIVEELIYAVPIIAMQASIFAMNSSDKYFLANFTADNNETVGIYSIATTYAAVIFLLSMAIIQYSFPKIYTILSSPVINYKAIKKQFLFYIAAMAGITVCIIAIAPFLYHFFIHEKYHAALKYIYIICLGNFFWAVSYFFYSFLLYNKEKRRLIGLALCSIVICVVLNYYLIKEWQDTGAAYSGFICYFLVLILTLLFTKKYWAKLVFHKD